jgi:cation-transporting ATPase F
VNVFIVIELFYLINCRSLTRSIVQLGLFTNPWLFGGIALMLALQMVYTYLPLMNYLFQSVPLDPAAWARIVLVGLFAYIIVESEKWLRRKQKTSVAE